MTHAEACSAKVDLGREADLRIGPLLVRPSIRHVEGPQGSQLLEPRVMQVLVCMARSAGDVVSRDALLAACWDGRIVTDDAISGCVAKVRRIGEASGAFRIATIARVGYRLDPTRAHPSETRRLRGVRWVAAAALGVLALVLGLGVPAWLAMADAKRAPPERIQVSVSAFRPLTDDAAAKVFATAAAEEISGVLIRTGVATVAPGTSAERALLSVKGSVDSSEGMVRTRVQLIDNAEGLALWAGEFQRPAGEAATMQSEVSWVVARVVSVALQAISSTPRPSADTTALYVQAHAVHLPGVFWNATTPTELAHRRALMGHVIRSDPNFALAHAMQGSNLLASARYAPPAEFRALTSQAKAEAHQALRLEPRLAFSWVTLALLQPSTAWRDREHLFQRAIAAQPADPSGNGDYGIFLAQTGAIAEGLKRTRRATIGFPSGTPAAVAHARMLHLSGNPDAALAYLDEQEQLHPPNSDLAFTRVEVAMLGGSLEEGTKAVEAASANFTPGAVAAMRAFLAAKRSRRDVDVEKAAKLIIQQARVRGLMRLYAIPMLLDLGRLDDAFAQADEYVQDPIVMRMASSLTCEFMFGPDARAMRADPRFASIVDRLGLLDYWRAAGRRPDFCRTEPAACVRLRLMTS